MGEMHPSPTTPRASVPARDPTRICGHGVLHRTWFPFRTRQHGIRSSPGGRAASGEPNPETLLEADIMQHRDDECDFVDSADVVQPPASALCAANFRAHPVIRTISPSSSACPDTICFPESALTTLPDDRLSSLLFSLERPKLFTAAVKERMLGSAHRERGRETPNCLRADGRDSFTGCHGRSRRRNGGRSSGAPGGARGTGAGRGANRRSAAGNGRFRPVRRRSTSASSLHAGH